MYRIPGYNTFQYLFITPYQQGFYNIRDAIKGNRVTLVAANAFPQPAAAPRITHLNLAQRITCLAVGLLLLVPLINTLMLMVLARLNSPHLYGVVAPVRQTPPDPLEPIVRTLSINQARLADVPNTINLAELNAIINGALPPVQLDQLLNVHFDRLFADVGDNQVLLNDQGRNLTKREARSSIQAHYIDFIGGHRGGDNNYYAMLTSEIEAFLKMIIIEFRKPEITDAHKKEMLKRLASAAEHCAPRRHGEALKIYRILSNQVETVEQVVLQYDQLVKEDLLQQYYSLSREPVMTLNYIRREVGQELGLDRSPVNLGDVHINLNDARSPDNPVVKHTTRRQFREVFDRIYTPANLLRNIKEYMNDRMSNNPDFMTLVSDFIRTELVNYQRAGLITQAEVDAYPAPYQNDLPAANDRNAPPAYLLTDLGMKFLLVHFRRVIDQTPGGHLVRVQPQPAVPQPLIPLQQPQLVGGVGA